MAQNLDIALSAKTYTRQDFTALRAFVQRIPLERIRDLYYYDDAPQINYPGGLERFLLDMRDDLITRALSANPHAAQFLQKARMGGNLTEKALQVIFEAAKVQTTTPLPSHPLSMWFRPRVAAALKETEASTIANLGAYINLRGTGWWRSVPRIGELRARAIEAWFQRHQNTLQITLALNTKTPLINTLLPSGNDTELIVDASGRNEGDGFCLISATNDVEAAKAFLLRYRGESPHTQDLYRREVTRLLLFCSDTAKRSLKNLTIEDFEAFKDYLANPPSHLIGRKAKRGTPQWKPFAGKLSVSSQRTTLRTVKVFLNWLVKMRYLGYNPAAAAKMPKDRGYTPQFTDKALDSNSWKQLIDLLDENCKKPSAKQLRIARAAIFIAGDCGLRREEIALLCRGWVTEIEAGVWLTKVLGKGNKWREVILSERSINAIKSHWEDRQIDFSTAQDDIPLIAPVTIKNTRRDQSRGYNPNSLARATLNCVEQLLAQPSELDLVAKDRLDKMTIHHLRHTFGSNSSEVMPLNILQLILGHADIKTTTIYTKANVKAITKHMTAFHRNDYKSP